LKELIREDKRDLISFMTHTNIAVKGSSHRKIDGTRLGHITKGECVDLNEWKAH
jgi:hypothetical protein